MQNDETDRQFGCGLPSRPQREVAPDPARLERAATLDNCGLGAPLPGGCALGGYAPEHTTFGVGADRQIGALSIVTSEARLVLSRVVPARVHEPTLRGVPA